MNQNTILPPTYNHINNDVIIDVSDDDIVISVSDDDVSLYIDVSDDDIVITVSDDDEIIDNQNITLPPTYAMPI